MDGASKTRATSGLLNETVSTSRFPFIVPRICASDCFFHWPVVDPPFAVCLGSHRPSPRLVLATEARVIGSFLGDDDVVGMAFLDRGRGHLDEPGLGPKLLDGPRAAIAHPGPQAADELEDEVGQRALVRDAALDPFGDELLARALTCRRASGRRSPGGIARAIPWPWRRSSPCRDRS